jgi:NADH-quinone oxidoreductase subunit L
MEASFWIPVLLGTAVLLPLISFFVILVAGARWMGHSGEHAAPVAIGAIGISGVLSFLALGIWLNNHWPTSSHAAETEHAAPDRGNSTHGDSAHGPTAPKTDAHSKEAPTKVAPSADAHATKTDASPAAGETHTPGNEHAAKPSTANHPASGEHGHAEPAVYAGEFNVPGLGVPWVLGQFGKLRVSISYYIDTLTICMFCMVTLIATLIHIYAMGYMHDELHDVTDKEVSLSNGET